MRKPVMFLLEFQGFTSYHEEDIRIGVGRTIERTAVLTLAGLAESVVVEGAGSRIEARDPGFRTRFGPEDLKTIPTRRSSMFDFIQEVQVQSVGASAEFGGAQGAVFNVVTRQGSDLFLYDASCSGQTAALTAQPVRRQVPNSGGLQSAYERLRYRDFTTNLGGPAVRRTPK